MTIELHLKALRLVPELWFAAQMTQRVSMASYPVTTLDELIAAVQDEGRPFARLDGVVITSDHAFEHFPRAFLPIQDEDELLTRLYAALCAGREFHTWEQKLSRHKLAVAANVED